MAVILSDGREKIKDAFHQILDTFITNLDLTRGVFIKPNIVFAAKPKSGEITPPSLAEALITSLRERQRNIDIIIGEGVAAGCDSFETFRISGYTELAQNLNVPLVDLHSVDRTTVAWKFGKLELPRIALDRTYINLPILKPSSACVISGALKNQKGLLLPAVKKQFHRLGLHEQIAELNAVVKPSLTIMDCSRFFGRNVWISGNNCGEIDATACHLLGIHEPDHVQLSRSARVFEPGFSVKGNTQYGYSPSRLTVKEYKHLGRLRLWANPRACTMCRHLSRDVQQSLWSHQNWVFAKKILTLSMKGAEIIMGSNPRWRKEYSTVICVGNCTRHLAKEGGYIFIPGCPPSISDLYENLPK